MTEPEDEAADPDVAGEPLATDVPLLRRRAFLRTALAVALATALGAFGWQNRESLAFGLSSDTPVDLGDFDALVRRSESPRRALVHNTYARFANGLVTAERRSNAGPSYFYDPPANLIVVTRRTLPVKQPDVVDIPVGYVPWLMGGWIQPLDLTVRFSGEGRVLDASRVTETHGPLADHFMEALRLSRRRPDEPLWIFVDEETPASIRSRLWAFGLGVIALMLCIAQAVRAYLEVRRAQAGGSR